VDPHAAAAGRQTDLDEIGVASTAREEKRRARAAVVPSADDERMAALYRQHVLKEPPPEPVIRIAGLGGTRKPA
jgi:7,8-dihydro-6-hydroxymethylpterin dimethyltransferase